MLTPAQQAAVDTDAPRVLCYAGPGSGKTRVLIARIVRLLEAGVHPTEIVAVTFTRKAAREMRERLEAERERLGARWSARRVNISTMHAFALATLREFYDLIGWPAGFTVRDDRDRADVLCFIAEQRDPKTQPPKTEAGRAKRAEAKARDPEVMKLYRRLMREAGAMDYEQLETELLRLFQDHPQAVDQLRRRHPFFLIDEGQDTSKRQQEIIDALDPRHRFDVGDPGQSIYGFRNADMAGFLALADVEGCEVHKLEDNFRSRPPIVEVVRRCALAMTPRGLDQIPGRTDEPEQPIRAVGVIVGDGSADLWATIAADVQHVHGLGIPWGEMAVLSPQWAPLHELAAVLERAGIPHHCPKTELGAWSTAEARWLVQLLRVALQPHDHLSLWSLLSHAAQRIRMWDWAPLRSESIRDGRPALNVALAWAHQGKLREDATELVLACGAIRGCVEAGQDALAFSGAVATLRDDLHRQHLAGRLADLVKVEDALQAWIEAAEEPTVRAFIDWWAEREVHDAEREERDEVALYSIHAAKGLEWKAVWVIADNGSLPRTSKPGPTREEERRVFYVACSRAQDRLRLCHLEGLRSPFVDEVLDLPPEPVTQAPIRPRWGALAAVDDRQPG